jgi:hypothetical protein
MILVGVFLQNQPGTGLLDTRVGVCKTILILLGFGFVLYDVSEKSPKEPPPKG